MRSCSSGRPVVGGRRPPPPPSAYVPGEVNLWPNLTGGEVIDLLGRLRGGLDRGSSDRTARALRARPHQEGAYPTQGNRQKVALVAALASDVELLILDEPTSGLDPLMEAAFRECVEEFRDDGHTVLLSSHILAEVEHLCDRVSIMRGRRRGVGLARRPATPDPTSISAELERAAPRLAGPPGCTTSTSTGTGSTSRWTRRLSTPSSTRCRRPGCGSLTTQPPTPGGPVPCATTPTGGSRAAPRRPW